MWVFYLTTDVREVFKLFVTKEFITFLDCQKGGEN